MKTKVKNISLTLAKILFTAGILYYLVSKGTLNFNLLGKVFESPVLVASLVLFNIVNILLGAYRWKILLAGQRLFLKYSSVLQLNMIGGFFNSTLPGAVSGDIVKFFYLSEKIPGVKKTEGFMTMLMDRLVGVAGLLFISLACLVEVPNTSQGKALMNFTVITASCFAIFFGLILVSGNHHRRIIRAVLSKFPIIGKFGLKIYLAADAYKDARRSFVSTIVISMVIHSTVIATFWVAARALGFEAPLAMLFLVVPLGLITTAIPIAPGGMGVGHVAFEKLFSMVGLDRGADLFNIMILFQVSINLTGGLVYLSTKRKPAAIITE